MFFEWGSMMTSCAVPCLRHSFASGLKNRALGIQFPYPSVATRMFIWRTCCPTCFAQRLLQHVYIYRHRVIILLLLAILSRLLSHSIFGGIRISTNKSGQMKMDSG